MRRRGANALEFALLVPVFVVASWGIIEFSWLMFQQGAVDESVQRGCRNAAFVDPGTGESDAEAVIEAAKAELIDQYTDQACDGCAATAALVGTVPQRSIQCTLDVPFTGFGLLLDSSTLTSTSTVRLEFQRRTQ